MKLVLILSRIFNIAQTSKSRGLFVPSGQGVSLSQAGFRKDAWPPQRVGLRSVFLLARPDTFGVGTPCPLEEKRLFSKPAWLSETSEGENGAKFPRWGNFASSRLLVWAILISLFCISALGWTWGDSLASKNRDAGALYKEGKVDEALSKWRGAQIETPDSDKLHYNIGNGLHRQKEYEDALKEYEKSLDSKDSELQQKAYYNMGNTRYRMGKLPEAIEDYKKCLDINPNDEDAKYNIEFIKKKLEEQPKKEESQQEENKDQEEQQKADKQSESQESKEAEENQENQNQERENKQQASQEEKEEAGGEGAEEKSSEEEKSSGEEKQGEMSKEDAARLLDAFKDDEKDIQKELRNQPAEGRYRVDKDW